MFFNKKSKNEITSKPIKKKLILPYIFRVLFIIFVVIGIYIIINFVKIFNRNEIKVYEVTNGEIVNVDRHKGFIYRDESVETCKTDGYINFYVANADRVNRGAFIYTINDVPSKVAVYELNETDREKIKQNIKIQTNNVTDNDFIYAYNVKDNIDNMINEMNIVKQLENIDIEREIDAKEKGYSKNAGLVSFSIDSYENSNILDFNEDIIKKYNEKSIYSQKKEVTNGDAVYKMVKSPEFFIAFDSSYDYDNYKKSNSVLVKFVYENITTNATIESFTGSDNKKHFKLNITEYPEKFIDKRVVDFEIENKKINGYKIPIKSITSKNCYIVPKNMLEKDFETDENVFYKAASDGTKEKLTCNISREDDKYYYISIDDSLSKLRFGDVLLNRYNDTYSLSDVVKLDGVYNMNKGYAVFKYIEIIDSTNEYAIVKKQAIGGISLYDHIALNASVIKEGDLIS